MERPRSTTGTWGRTPRPITITADAKAKQFGAADPPLTWQLTLGNLVGTDPITGALTRVTGEAVGSYAIQQGTLTAGTNYALTYVSANLTIGGWHATGFYQPIGITSSVFVTAPGAAPSVTSSTVWNAAKGGSTIPLKFNLYTCRTQTFRCAGRSWWMGPSAMSAEAVEGQP